MLLSKKITLIIFYVLAALPLLAQPGDPCPNPPFCDPDVPITGIEYLLIAGGAIGMRKFLRSRKKS